MSSELKKCPWCGLKLRVGKGKRRKHATLYQKAGEWMWRPSINHRCNISKRPRGSFMSINIEGESVEEVAEIWNTRKA